MTDKEKAKAYDEALERARKALSEISPENYSARKIIEDAFPELKENEDERIRKAIIKSIEEDSSVYEQDVSKEQMLAYLEKQKYDRMKPIYDARDSFESALAKAWKEYNDSGSRTVDGCEDDYVECAHAKGFREGYLFGIEKQKEQKPKRERNKPKESWLEKAKYELAHEEELLIKRQKELSEIRALKDKEQKQEWSEEDEAMYTAFTCEVVNEKMDPTLEQIKWLRGVRDRLKSFRSSWKPSCEQLEALLYAMSFVSPASKESVLLSELYENLRNCKTIGH